MQNVCKTCHGTGWVDNPNSPKEFLPLKCIPCNGTGIITSSYRDGGSQTAGEADSLSHEGGPQR